MTVAEQVLQLPKYEKLKLKLMVVLWADLSREESDYESPAWHERELKKTRARLDAGVENVMDLATAKRLLDEEFNDG